VTLVRRTASINTNAVHTPYYRVLGYRIDCWDSNPGRARISISGSTSDKLWDRPNESFLGKTSQLWIRHNIKISEPLVESGLNLAFRNIEFSDSIHRPGIKKQTKGNKTFRKLDLFPSSCAGKKKTYSVRSLRKS
jgi:hypothetical protein